MRRAVHDIRNQLAVAVAGIESFLDRKLEPTDARLEGILFSLHAIDALVDELPRDRTIEFETHAEPIDLGSLIASGTAAMEGFATERGVTITMRRSDGMNCGRGHFFGDAARIGEIVTNVLTNAIHYAGAGGSVDVECRRDPSLVHLTVTDRGPGIEESDLAHLFEAGFRGSASAATPGTGMGLTIVKAIVESYGGSIEATNRHDGGATFSVRLPVADETCGDCARLTPIARMAART